MASVTWLEIGASIGQEVSWGCQLGTLGAYLQASYYVLSQVSSECDGWIQRFKDAELYMCESRSWESQMLHSITSASLYLLQGQLRFKGKRNGLHLAVRGVTNNLQPYLINHSPSLDHEVFIFLTNANVVNSSRHS